MQIGHSPVVAAFLRSCSVPVERPSTSVKERNKNIYGTPFYFDAGFTIIFIRFTFCVNGLKGELEY